MNFETTQPPDRIGDYNVLETIGRGSSADVMLVRKEGDDQLAVLKRLHLKLTGDRLSRARFEREVSIIEQLSHPNIARQMDSMLEGDSPWVVFELVDGHDINKMLRAAAAANRRIPAPLAVLMIRQVLKGVAHAHNFALPDGTHGGLVHRDLAPKNLMVGYAGEVKIIDFGVARARFDQFRTTPGTRIGTIRYMSPEQALGEEVDARSDLYTVGVVLWELLTGTQLVVTNDAIEALEAIAYHAATPLSATGADVPDALAEVVQRSLSKKRDRRFQTAQEFEQALAEVTAGWPPSPPSALADFLLQLFPSGGKRLEYEALERTRLEAQPTTVVTSTEILDTKLREPDTRAVAMPMVQTVLRPPAEPSSPLLKKVVGASLALGVIAASFGGGILYERSQKLPGPTPMPTTTAAPRPAEVVPAIVQPSPAKTPEPQLEPTPARETKRLTRVEPKPAERPREVESAPAPRPRGELRARLAALGNEPTEEALFTLHDDIAARARGLTDQEARRAVQRELETFQRSGKINALERAIDALSEN